MSEVKVTALHTGDVRVSPYLPFGGDNCSMLKASGLTTPKKDWIWLPVYCYLIEMGEKKILVDTGWHRSMSPAGVWDRKAQIRSLGSWLLYLVNQGVLPEGQAIDEQLATRGIRPSDLDYVLLTHLDCDHANGLEQVKEAREILVARDEMLCARKHGMRYKKQWWQGVAVKEFDWNSAEGPFGKSYDVLGDGSVMMINIPGHSDGLCAVKVRNKEGKYVLLFADGGYATRSWKEMITSGVALDKQKQRRSLEWIREQSLSADCIESLATHDTEVKPHTIEF